MRLDAVRDLRVAVLAARAFLFAGGDELIAPLMQHSQTVALIIALLRGRRLQRLRHNGEHPRVDRIGFGEEAGGAGEVAGAGRIDAGEDNAGASQRLPQAGIVATCRLEQDQHRCAFPAFSQQADRLLRVGYALGTADAAVKNVEMTLGDIDSTKARVYLHGPLPVLRGPLLRPRSTVQVGYQGRAGIRPARGLARPGTQRSPARTYPAISQHTGTQEHDLIKCTPVFLVPNNGLRRFRDS